MVSLEEAGVAIVMGDDGKGDVSVNVVVPELTSLWLQQQTA